MVGVKDDGINDEHVWEGLVDMLMSLLLLSM